MERDDLRVCCMALYTGAAIVVPYLQQLTGRGRLTMRQPMQMHTVAGNCLVLYLVLLIE